MRSVFSPRACLLFALALGFAARARAQDTCDYFRSNVPDMYEFYCEGGSRGSPSGSNSSFTQAFSLSPASLPTGNSPYGIETLTHRIRGNGEIHPDFSLVKGFHKFGAGFSTAGNRAFYGNDVIGRAYDEPTVRSFHSSEESRGKLPDLNFGAALNLFRIKGGPALSVGVSARHNKLTNTWGGGPALLASWGPLSVGYGYSREKVSNYLDRVTFLSGIATFRFWRFELQYDHLTDTSPYGLKPIQIMTVTLHLPHVLLTAARRTFDAQRDRVYGTPWSYPVTQDHYAAQVLLSRYLTVGFLYNFVPGATTLGTQIFF